MKALKKNKEIVGQALDILQQAMLSYLFTELHAAYQDDWWQKAVMNKLYEDSKIGLPQSGPIKTLLESLDVSQCLRIIDVNWNDVFRRKLSNIHHSWLKETIDTRNNWAHLGVNDFSDSDTIRALDTMARFTEQIDNDCTVQLRSLLRMVTYGSEEGSVAADTSKIHPVVPDASSAKRAGVLMNQSSTLKSWRDVMQPHPDVAQGRYKNAEFAADLAQVARGEGSIEYLDPVEFFARTYITEGMAGLLVQGLKRLIGRDGDPVVQLKTSFGGGKTHSMLALYHLFHGQIRPDQSINVKHILQQAGIKQLPEAHVAVIVGTALNPAKSKRPATMPGITVNTLWGEIAFQLAVSSKNPKLYDHVKDADKKGVSPGSTALRDMFDECGSCLILIDELVAYAKKIYGVDNLPSGSFDNLVSFIQELTEAARSSRSSMVVASLPESELEIGGEAGQIVLEQIEHTFGRMEAIWKPVTANESFEVVRRRLFLPCKDEAARDDICSAFNRMYNDNASDFPVHAKDTSYKQRMLACYPIHPEFFDFLYDKWASIEKFQKTRGVLRLMAGVVYYLWMNADASCMIMPGSLPINNPSVRDELTRYLPENWNSIVDSEVDGKDSVPYAIDTENQRFGKVLAARRLARTIFLGSAPGVREQTLRGIEDVHLRVGTILPDENIAIFNDALVKLKSKLSYLYTNEQGNRFWFDNRPTLRKIVKERAATIPVSEVEYALEQRLHKWNTVHVFGSVHVCPSTSGDVPDDQNLRLIILPVDYCHERNKQDSKAMQYMKSVLESRGNALRTYKNMLIFMAPDMQKMFQVQKTVKIYLAWKEIQKEAENRNLDAIQLKEVRNSIDQLDKAVQNGLSQAYSWVMAPFIDIDGDLKKIDWDYLEITCTTGDNIKVAVQKLVDNESLIENWGARVLQMQLDTLLWKECNHLPVKQLWEYLTSYCYLPRLVSRNVLGDTICKGVADGLFGFAEEVSEGKYLRLKYNTTIYSYDVLPNTLIVKKELALRQIEQEASQQNGSESVPVTTVPAGTGPNPTVPEPEEKTGGMSGVHEPTPPELPQNKHFFLSVPIDPVRVNKDVSKYMDEIVSHLMNQPGVKTSLKLEVQIELPDGTPQNVVRTVTENCHVLHVDDNDYGFDD